MKNKKNLRQNLKHFKLYIRKKALSYQEFLHLSRYCVYLKGTDVE